jgi:hypothetical protein
MKRLPGIIVSAIVLVLGSLLQLLMSASMALAGAIAPGRLHSDVHAGAPPAPPVPAWMPVFMYVMAAFFLGLAVWGIVTAIGLFRLWRWARYSVLVIGGCLVLIGLPSMLIMLVLMMVPLPLPPNVDASQAQALHTVMRTTSGVISVFYAAMCAVGVSWLVYFNRKKVRDVFAGTPGQVIESPRPFLISVIAVLTMIGGAICLLMAFIPFPGLIFGFRLFGWQKTAIYLLFAFLITAAGVGLWRLKEWGRRLAIAMQIIGMAQNVILLVRPSLMTNYAAEINRAMTVIQPPAHVQFQAMLYMAMFGLNILFVLAILWVLVHYRGVFGPRIGPPKIESTAQAD